MTFGYLFDLPEDTAAHVVSFVGPCDFFAFSRASHTSNAITHNPDCFLSCLAPVFDRPVLYTPLIPDHIVPHLVRVAQSALHPLHTVRFGQTLEAMTSGLRSFSFFLSHSMLGWSGDVNGNLMQRFVAAFPRLVRLADVTIRPLTTRHWEFIPLYLLPALTHLSVPSLPVTRSPYREAENLPFHPLPLTVTHLTVGEGGYCTVTPWASPCVGVTHLSGGILSLGPLIRVEEGGNKTIDYLSTLFPGVVVSSFQSIKGSNGDHSMYEGTCAFFDTTVVSSYVVPADEAATCRGLLRAKVDGSALGPAQLPGRPLILPDIDYVDWQGTWMATFAHALETQPMIRVEHTGALMFRTRAHWNHFADLETMAEGKEVAVVVDRTDPWRCSLDACPVYYASLIIGDPRCMPSLQNPGAKANPDPLGGIRGYVLIIYVAMVHGATVARRRVATLPFRLDSKTTIRSRSSKTSLDQHLRGRLAFDDTHPEGEALRDAPANVVLGEVEGEGEDAEDWIKLEFSRHVWMSAQKTRRGPDLHHTLVTQAGAIVTLTLPPGYIIERPIVIANRFPGETSGKAAPKLWGATRIPIARPWMGHFCSLHLEEADEQDLHQRGVTESALAEAHTALHRKSFPKAKAKAKAEPKQKRVAEDTPPPVALKTKRQRVAAPVVCPLPPVPVYSAPASPSPVPVSAPSTPLSSPRYPVDSYRSLAVGCMSPAMVYIAYSPLSAMLAPGSPSISWDPSRPFSLSPWHPSSSTLD